MTHLLRVVVVVGLAVHTSVCLAQGTSVSGTPHNLSATGPSSIRAASEEQVCVFCHTPHNASLVQPLWNRFMPISAYSVYSSSSLDSSPGQPTGSSKMCLSCHDGTIALGSVISRDQVIQIAGGITTIPPGSSNLGTDLSDDHPIAFAYDSSLAGQDPNLINPDSLPPELPLDHNSELQCTTCHNAHDNTYGDFLVMSNATSQLCLSCHQIQPGLMGGGHADCVGCHQTHSSPSGPFLLRQDNVTNTCTTCHDGSVSGAQDILSDLNKFSVHDTFSPVDPNNPIPAHATCADCHDPHTMVPGSASAPTIHPLMGSVNGINASGSPVEAASFEYEVCFKCHADETVFTSSWRPRQITQTNTRLEFASSAISFHPVTTQGRNPDVPSLKPGWTTSSMMYCSDCHASDGGGASGVHGSNEPPLLVARYETADFTPESASAYALCYQCHDRDTNDGILKDRSFDKHKKHIEGEDAACSTCHDPHGISSLQGTSLNNAHLINFDTSIVFPDPRTGRLEFRDLGQFAGECYLLCHGEAHSPERYD